MKIFTAQEGEKWLQGHQLPIERGEIRFLYKKYILAYLFPLTIGSKTILSESIAERMGEGEGDGAFWITDWGISYENMNLFDGYRKSLNENRSLEEAPFHVFNKADKKELECLLDLAMYFFWDAFLISPNREVSVYISHDDYIDVTCKNENDYKKYRELFEWMKFKEIKN